MSVLVGKRAPVFWAPAVLDGNIIEDNFSLDNYLGKKYVVFSFIPQILHLSAQLNCTPFKKK